MPSVLLKVQKNKNITLPTAVMTRFHLSAGDFIRLEDTTEGVLLKPAKLVDPSQAYFWSKEWQQGEREAEDDIRRSGGIIKIGRREFRDSVLRRPDTAWRSSARVPRA